jgi:aspartate/glutamate racemase
MRNFAPASSAKNRWRRISRSWPIWQRAAPKRWCLAARGAEAVVLGCTEISLLIRQEHTPVPLLDTTTLHAAAAVEFALKAL